MRIVVLAGICMFASLASVLAAASEEAAKSRGQLLYENHCIRCHETSVHTRNPSRVTRLDDLYQWVEKWASVQHLGWKQNDIRDVVDYLNQEYYHLKK